MQTDGEGPEIPEMEVERLPPRGESPPGAAGSGGRSFGERARSAVDPIAAGLVVDLLDLFTRGPAAPFGLLVGVPLGYWLGRSGGLPKRRALLLGFGVGFYCLLPMSSGIPLGTIVGAYLRFFRD